MAGIVAMPGRNIIVFSYEHNLRLSNLYLINMKKGPLSLTLILAWISNYIHCKAGDEITYPFQTSLVQPLKFWNG